MADLLDKLMPLLEGIVDSSGQLNLTNLNVGALVPLLKGAIAQRGSGAKQPGQRRLTLIDPQATLYYYQMNCRAWPPGLIKAALDMMLAEPLLIRRPLMEVDGALCAGFDAKMVDTWIGLNDSQPKEEPCPICHRSEPCPTPEETSHA